jgi:hypothetical protein
MLTLVPIERVGSISKGPFLGRYRVPRRPIVLEDFTAAWPARKKWSVEYLQSVAEHRQIPVYDSGPSSGHRHQHAAAGRMPLGEYVQRLRAGENDLRIFFLRVVEELPELLADFSYPDVGVRYVQKLSVLFMGGRGARVQMHFDIDLADIFLCHFGGRKRVILFPPDQTPYLYRVPFSFSTLSDVRPDAPDYERFPALGQALGVIAELGHGDALYIPAGYWHYVRYDDIGFSLSLRTLPGTPRDLVAALHNILVLRTVDGVMRKVLGQRWNDRNERLALERARAAQPLIEGLARRASLPRS